MNARPTVADTLKRPTGGQHIEETYVAHALCARTQKSGDPTTDTFVTAATQSVRRLTPTETERLQSFPDGWTILPETLAANPDESNPKPDSHRYAQMGNAVTVNVAEWIGERIMEATQ